MAAGIRMSFRTLQSNALLFFTASAGQQEFIALQMRSNKLWFLFDTQGPTLLTYLLTYTRGEAT